MLLLHITAHNSTPLVFCQVSIPLPGKLLFLLGGEDKPGLKELWHVDHDPQDDDWEYVESEGVAGGAGAGANQEVVGMAH